MNPGEVDRLLQLVARLADDVAAIRARGGRDDEDEPCACCETATDMTDDGVPLCRRCLDGDCDDCAVAQHDPGMSEPVNPSGNAP